MMLWTQAWEAVSPAAVAVSYKHLLSLAVVLLVALVAVWRSKLPLHMRLLLLSLAVAVAAVAMVAVGGWRQRLPLGAELGIRTCACPGDLSGL